MEDRTGELQAARAANREMMTRLNTVRHIPTENRVTRSGPNSKASYVDTAPASTDDEGCALLFAALSEAPCIACWSRSAQPLPGQCPDLL